MKNYKRAYVKIIGWIGLVSSTLLALVYWLLGAITVSLIPLLLSIPAILSLLYSKWVLELLKETRGKK